MSQTIEFLRPAYIGDTIEVIAKVKQKSLASRILVLSLSIKNQHNEELIKGEAAVKVLALKDKERKMEDNKKRSILITGGAKGIGAATAKRLAADGHNVIVNYLHSEKDAEKLINEIIKGGGSAMSFRADIASMKEVKDLFKEAEKKMGPIDAVVHCAAPSNAPKPFDKLDWDSFQGQLDVHLKGAFNCASLSIPRMAETGVGDFIFIGSVYTDSMPPSQQSRYIVAKAALTSLGKCLAAEYGHKGIRVNIVSPGMTQTDMIAVLPDKVKMFTKMQTPLRRLAEPSDIANTIAFLLRPESRHITGETIRVCGGSVML